MQSRSNKFITYLIGLYAFVVCFGNIFKFTAGESSAGVSTVILFIILISKLPTIPSQLFRNNVFLFTFIALVMSLLSAQFHPGDISRATQGSFILLTYLLVAVATSAVNFSVTELRTIFIFLAIGLGLAGILTVIDYIGIANIPGANESNIATEIGRDRIEQAGGFFSRRSALAAFTALAAPMIFILSVYEKKGTISLLLVLCGLSGMLALFLSHNRSGIFAVIICMLLFLAFTRRFNISNKIKLSIIIFLISLVALIALYTYFPDHISVYTSKLSRIMPNTSKQISESDYSRVYFFIEALKSILDSPIGHGFAPMYTPKYHFLSPHNAFSYLIWAIGIFAFIIFPFVIIKIRHSLNQGMRNAIYSPYAEAIKYGLLAWLLNNMAHSSIGMGLFWIYLGIAIGISNTAKTSYAKPVD